jgi:Protein of unknown function (DUF3102)
MSSLKADKKAQSLVPQIKQAHDALAEAETKGFRQSLELAIELGVLLNLAHEAVYHGHWETWFTAQGFNFSRRSATRYMRLAKEREKLEAEANWPRVAKMAAEGELSIRSAEALLKPEKATAAPKATAAKRTAGSPDLVTLLKGEGPDVIKTALKQADKFDELAAAVAPPFDRQLKNCSPMRLAETLIGTWKSEDVRDLIRELSDRLKSQEAPRQIRPVTEMQASRP